MDLENVLVKVPGAYVAAAIRDLPEPSRGSPAECTTELTVPHLGLVRFYFKRLTAKKGKSRHVFWTAQRAVVINPDE